MNKTNHIYDVIIVGGGLAGLLQTILLAQNGINVLCIDKQTALKLKKSPLGRRTTAISYGSHQLIKAANLWHNILPFACPIKDIQILDGSSPVLLNFDIKEDINAQKSEGFGWVVENHQLREILLKHLKTLETATYKDGFSVTDIKYKKNTIQIQTDQNEFFESALLIGADGRQSFIRQHSNIDAEAYSYNQRAIVSIITHENPHNNIAIEHFKPSGPFAILPMCNDSKGNHRSSIVWTEDNKSKRSILNFDDSTYLIALNTQFPESYGQITSTTQRFSYPLGYIHAHNYITERTALIGDAAHGIHPIAGQGLNLGLRDVAALTELILNAKENKKNVGKKELLEKYQQHRKSDNHLMSLSTDSINRIFSNNMASMKFSRKIGLKLMNRFRPAKKLLLSQMMGTAGDVPKIIKNGKV